jgi:hypothetical protein
MVIALGNKDNTYTISIRADKAVLKLDEGGALGDPFESIAIDRGSVLLGFYGGSNWRWYYSYRFRLQDNDWFLIAATQGSYFNGNRTKQNGGKGSLSVCRTLLQEKNNLNNDLLRVQEN